jgi:exopolyphosphatase/guanosine-5'-triphosphate,3'-diphosphate pyrophosphatase
MDAPVAAIDVGSNSLRVAVIRAGCNGSLEVIEESRAVLRLIRDVQASGRLSERSITNVLDVLRDFQAIARGASAGRTIAVATSAVRDAANSEELVRRVREALGLDLHVVSGTDEARLAFLGSVHSLPVAHGIVVDVGGGSMELVRFEDRQPVAPWTLPLGAVRLTDRFLTSDPPTQQQVRALRKHVLEQIRKADVPPLESGDALVGTGGTIRNLAKVDRAQHAYPLPRLHGYTVTKARLRGASDLLRSRKLTARAAIPGLNEDRADTIVAGALVLQAVFDALKGREIVVSGQGLREGIAFSTCSDLLPPVSTVRDAAVGETLALFAPMHLSASKRRIRILDELQRAVGGEHLPPDFSNALQTAAALLDVGRSVDYYGRHRYTESILLTHGLSGFTHREQALVCAIIRQAAQERYDPLAYRPLMTNEDRPAIARASAILMAADEIQQRIPPDAPLGIRCSRTADRLEVSMDLPHPWQDAQLLKRFERAFGIGLVITGS